MNANLKRLMLSTACAGSLMVSGGVTAFAGGMTPDNTKVEMDTKIATSDNPDADEPEGTQSNVNLQVKIPEKITFKAQTGKVDATKPADYQIKNEGTIGVVKVDDMTGMANSPFVLKPYTTDFASSRVDSKEFGMAVVNGSDKDLSVKATIDGVTINPSSDTTMQIKARFAPFTKDVAGKEIGKVTPTVSLVSAE